jgi:phage terminase large subunit-like protein
MFASGQVWFPETRWATEVVEELLAFPASEHDDLTDSLSLALIRIRKGGILRLNNDYDDNPMYNLPSGKRSYY